MSYGLAAGMHRLLWVFIWVVPGPRWLKLLGVAALILGPTLWRRSRRGRGGWRGGRPTWF